MSVRKNDYSCPVGHENCDVVDAVTVLQQRTAELETQIQTDALTGLINFRGFNERLEQEIERTRRLEEPTCLVMIDIDHFKQVNDTHGHDVGNQALTHIAELLRQDLRKIDLPCRFGGEEFALILPATRLAPAVQVAERIRRLVEKTPLMIGRKKISMTISLGVEHLSSSDPRSAAEFLKSADNYLYQAKHTGRNCTCHPPIDLSSEKAAVTRQERQDLFTTFGRKED